MRRHAIEKKLAKKFKVGDIVTWGNKLIAHRVIDVQKRHPCRLDVGEVRRAST